MEQQNNFKPPFLKGAQIGTLVVESKHYPILKGMNTIGRNKTAVVNIKHLTVSQHHAVIVAIDETQFYISDMHSSNGTFIHGKTMVPLQLYKLTNNAEIKFGELNAVFSNIVATNSAQNDTLEASQLSQTQTFYASNTQVLLNPTEVSNACGNGDQTVGDIHEVATQVEFHPPPVPKPKKKQFGQNIRKEEAKNQQVEEEIINDIHDELTQVCNFVSDDAVAQEKEIAMQVFNISGPIEENLMDNDNKVEDVDSESDPNTQVMTEEELENISKKLKGANEAISLVTPTESEDFSNVEPESDIKKEEKKNVDCFSSKFESKTIHNSQEPSTSGMQRTSIQYDDSFASSIDSSKAEDFAIEETLLHNDNSNNSLDFFLANIENLESYNKDSQEDSAEKKNTPVHTTPKSDPEINCKDTNKPQEQSKMGKNDSSDSETDCEDALLESLSLRLSADLSHDSNIKSNKVCDDLDDSDCIPATQDAFAKELDYKPLKSSQTSNLQSSEESFKLGLTELMEFPEMDNIEDSKKSQSSKKQSSLDIKEVENHENLDNAQKSTMHETDNKNLDNEDAYIQPTQNDEDVFLLPTQQLPINKPTDIKKSSKEDIYSQPTQKLEETCLEPTENVDDVFLQPTQIDVPNKIIDRKRQTKNDIYSQPTQKLDEDVYLEPTQKINDNFLPPTQTEPSKMKSKSDIYSQPTQKLEDDILLAPTQQMDDVFLQPTQEIMLDKPVKATNDDMYCQPTQKLADETCLEPIQEIDDVFVQPTQELVLNKPVDRKRPTEEDLYCIPTQKLDEDVFVQPTTIKKSRKSKNVSSESEDVFLMPSKVRESNNKRKSSHTSTKDESFKIKPNTSITIDDDDPYAQLTQPIEDPSTPNKSRSKVEDAYLVETQALPTDINNGVTESQLEMENYGTFDLNIPSRTDRPGNPILCELDNSKDDSDTDATCIESMSQIEAFIENSGTKPRVVKTETVSNKAKCGTSLNNSIETLSQIEAFIQKPLPPRKSDTSHQFKKGTEKGGSKKNDGVPETLSQITAFISKPQHTKIKEEKGIIENKYSKNVSKSRVSRGHDEPLSRTTLDASNQEDFNRTNNRGLLSDVDQSFALLESKSSRVKRKPTMDPVLEEIKVRITSHRRSMQVEENKDATLIIPTKKSKADSILRPSEIEVPNNKSRSRKPKVPSPSSEAKPEPKSSSKETKTKGSRTKTPSENNCPPEDIKLKKSDEEQQKNTETRRRTTRKITLTHKVAAKSSRDNEEGTSSKSKESTLSTDANRATLDDVKSTEKRAPKTRGRPKNKEAETSAPKSRRQK